VLAKVRRWGNSLGLIVPADIVRARGLREGDQVDIEIRQRVPTIEELAGSFQLRTNLKTLLREMEEGWDDL